MPNPRRVPTTLLTTFTLAAAASAFAAPADLSAQADHDAHADHASPYADLTDRAIKALSPEETAGLEEGEGLGFALAAELNGAPGPLHSLEMADGLGLTDAQVQALREVEAQMKDRARALGARIIELEGELDRRFAHGHVTADDVERLTGEIGSARGALRAVHLVAHIRTTAVLDADQVAAYNRMRGYGG